MNIMITGNDTARYIHFKPFWATAWTEGLKLPSLKRFFAFFKKKTPHKVAMQMSIAKQLDTELAKQLIHGQKYVVMPFDNGTLIIKGDQRIWTPRV